MRHFCPTYEELRITSLIGVGSIFGCDFPAELQVRQGTPAGVVEALKQSL